MGGWVLTGMGAKTLLLLTGAGVGGLGAGECWDCFAQGVGEQEGGQHPWQSCLVVGREGLPRGWSSPTQCRPSGDAWRKDGSDPSPLALP